MGKRKTDKKMPRVTWLLLTMLLLTGCSRNVFLTVSETREKAESLEGKLIRVRGRARFFTEPYQGLTGCVPGGGRDIVGRLELYDENAPDPRYYGGKQPLPKIIVSESSLQCRGNTCQVTCAPFNPEEAGIFELVGTLRIDNQQGKKVFTLENVNLKESRKLLGEKLGPIPTGTFQYNFP